MTIDERLEALTQSVELLAHMHQGDHENLEALRALVEKHEERFRQNSEHLARLDSIAERIARIL